MHLLFIRLIVYLLQRSGCFKTLLYVTSILRDISDHFSLAWQNLLIDDSNCSLQTGHSQKHWQHNFWKRCASWYDPSDVNTVSFSEAIIELYESSRCISCLYIGGINSLLASASRELQKRSSTALKLPKLWKFGGSDGEGTESTFLPRTVNIWQGCTRVNFLCIILILYPGQQESSSIGSNEIPRISLDTATVITHIQGEHDSRRANNTSKKGFLVHSADLSIRRS